VEGEEETPDEDHEVVRVEGEQDEIVSLLLVECREVAGTADREERQAGGRRLAAWTTASATRENAAASENRVSGFPQG
jgi:hypothetical protein